MSEGSGGSATSVAATEEAESVEQQGSELCRGKTKVVYQARDNYSQVVVNSKDDITAGDGAKRDALVGKSRCSNRTTSNVFRLLHLNSIPTHFLYQESHSTFRALKCSMIPVEVIVRRVATGSYIKRHSEVKEGTRFLSPLIEFTFKSDVLHDPLITDEELIGKALDCGGLLVDEVVISKMKDLARSSFLILERAWQLLNVVLVDFKVEFGVTVDGRLVLADVIDNDSWRIWPGGDKSMMKDKQVYRNMVGSLTEEGRRKLIENYEWTAEKSSYLLDSLVQDRQNTGGPVVGVIMGSQSDWETMKNACSTLQKLGVAFESRIVSAHRTPERLFTYAKTAQSRGLKVIIAGAGGAAHLPGMISSLTTLPVLGVPVQSKALNGMDSLLSIAQMPGGVPVGSMAIGTSGAINAALLAASILGVSGEHADIRVELERFRAQQTEDVAEFPVDHPSEQASQKIPTQVQREHFTNFSQQQLPPGSIIGIVGGGQLAKMIAAAAAQLGYKCHIFSPDKQSPAFQICFDKTIADYNDKSALSMFAAKVDVITYEFENIPYGTLEILSKYRPVRPNPKVLSVCQNRVKEKTLCNQIGLETAKFETVNNDEELVSKIQVVGLPAVLKSNTMGYDGKGQVMLNDKENLGLAWKKIQATKCESAILEGFVDFKMEISVIVCRGFNGQKDTFPAVTNRHENHILKQTTVPAEVSERVKELAKNAALAIADHIDLVGVLAVEMFVTKDDRVLVNEMAPRPHNSGHWTIEGCSTSQFEQLVRSICGLPLGSMKLMANRVEMTNLLGEEANMWMEILKEDSSLCTALHLYGKSTASPGRKMGHVTKLFN